MPLLWRKNSLRQQKKIQTLNAFIQFTRFLTSYTYAQTNYCLNNVVELGVFMISSGPVEDRLAIRELVDSYNDAVMRLDGEAWASNWTDDGIWSLPGVGEVAGKAKFYPMWQQAMSAFSFVGFFASAGPIIVTGDTAHGTWYQQEFLHMKAGGKQTITGQYEDDYVRKDGRWYFAKRVYAVLDRQVSE